MKTIYFAHPISSYDTPFEEFLLSRISDQFPEYRVLNPNAPEHQLGYRERGMDYFINLCLGCHAVAYVEFPGQWVGAGVAAEIQVFKDRELPTFCWVERESRFIEHRGDIHRNRILDVPATRIYLKLATEFPMLENIIDDNPDEFNNEVVSGHDLISWLQCNWLLWKEFEKRALTLVNLGKSRYSARTIIEGIRWESDVSDLTSFWKINNNRSTADLSRLFHHKYPNHQLFNHRTSSKRQ